MNSKLFLLIMPMIYTLTKKRGGNIAPLDRDSRKVNTLFFFIKLDTQKQNVLVFVSLRHDIEGIRRVTA